ncbi:MAG: GGDEF domain-containing protein [Acidobacteria bacterium]|nr:GGDEF domain-containing protein [Acidobacteriota bacterium]
MQERTELRAHVVRRLEQRASSIVSDAAAVFPFAGLEGVDAENQTRLASLILELLTVAARDGEVDMRRGAVGELRQLARTANVAIRPLFGLVYVMERAALDELALDESFGATTEPWPSIAQLVRRCSVDVLASFSEHVHSEPGSSSVTDPLTTLHTKAVLMAVLEKEIQRSERFGHPFALIMLDVDRLADINAKHGYGAGDRLLERIGILVRTYFREHDWVARLGGDSFAVLLPETAREYAESLADLVRKTVEERLELHDYRSEEQVPVTVSVGVVIAQSVDQSTRAEQLMVAAKEAVDRAKQGGRNRVEVLDVTVARAAPARDAQARGLT